MPSPIAPQAVEEGGGEKMTSDANFQLSPKEENPEEEMISGLPEDFPEGDGYIPDTEGDAIGLKSKSTIRLSQTSLSTNDKQKRFNGKSQIGMNEIMQTHNDKEQAVAENRKLKKIVLLLVVAVILLCAGAFASSFAAIQISKESRISEGGVMVDLDPGTNDKTIVQVAAATESKLNLFHALVLDEAHLRTIDEVVYTYNPDGFPTGVQRTVTDKVLKVVRDVGEDPLDVNVTIILQGNSRVVIDPKAVIDGPMMLFTDGKGYPLCGQMKCANFKVDDPDLDVKLLDQKVNEVFHEDTEDTDATSLDDFSSSNQSHGRRLVFWQDDFGCCSTSGEFILGKASGNTKPDTARCTTNNQGSLESSNLRRRSHATRRRNDGPSQKCFGHDTCLPSCDNYAGEPSQITTPLEGQTFTQTECGCKGRCDWKLHHDMKDAWCSWTDCVCAYYKWQIIAGMWLMPSGCK